MANQFDTVYYSRGFKPFPYVKGFSFPEIALARPGMHIPYDALIYDNFRYEGGTDATKEIFLEGEAKYKPWLERFEMTPEKRFFGALAYPYEHDIIFEDVAFAKELETDYSQSTWQKKIAGVPKFKLGEFYEKHWPIIEPQIRDHNVLTRNVYDGDVVRRHSSASNKYQRIGSKDDLIEMVRRHAVEFLPETGTSDDPYHTQRLIVDIDPQGKVEPEKVKQVAYELANEMKKVPGVEDVYAINTNDGFHVIGDLNLKMTFPRAKKLLRRQIFPNVPDGTVRKEHGKPYLDLAPMKRRGSTRIYGGINYPSMTISERIPLSKIREFKPMGYKQ
jgi:hypothetical protein